MSDIVRRTLPPIGRKPVTMSEHDAREYANELIRIALFGLATYHPDGGRISDRDRLERLRKVPQMVRLLHDRVTSIEAGEALRRMQRDSIPALADRIRNQVEAIENRKYQKFPQLGLPGMDRDRAMEISDWDKPRR